MFPDRAKPIPAQNETLKFCALTADIEGESERARGQTLSLLELFDNLGVKATLFVLGRFAQDHPDIIAKAARQGHEIGFHSFQHKFLSELTPEQLRKEAREWSCRLEDIAQAPVHGYRAPYFSITPRTRWALEVLAETGFRYDASIYPGPNDRYGWIGAPLFPCQHQGTGLKIFPVPMLHRLFPIAFSGGAYLRMLPWPIVNLAMRFYIGPAHMIYVHPWEFEPYNRRNAVYPGIRQLLTGQLGRRKFGERVKDIISNKGIRIAPMRDVWAHLTPLPNWNPQL